MSKMVPYSVYLPIEYYDKIKELAKERRASAAVRDAIQMIIDGNDSYSAGYRKAIKEAISVVNNCSEIEHIAIRGKHLKQWINQQLEQLQP